jgi:hypothetical protein
MWLSGGDPEASAIVQGAVESFAQEFARVFQRFLKLKAWKDAERLIVVGGFSGRRVSNSRSGALPFS